MQATLARADVTYQSIFKRPLLDRQAGTPALIQTVYDVLSDNFKVAVADIVFNQSGGPSDHAVVFKLFGGAASIELRSEFWKATFLRVVTPDDVKLVLRCLTAVSDAITKSSDRLASSKASVGVSGWYKVSGDFDAASFFKAFSARAIEIEPNFLGSRLVEHSLNLTLKNDEEGWDTTILVQASLIEDTQLFMNTVSNYVSGGRFGSLEAQAGRAETLAIEMLNKFGFETPPKVVTSG